MMDAEELELTRQSFRSLLTTTAPADQVAALLDAGWADLLAADERAAVSLLAREQGRAGVVGPALDLAVLHGLGVAADDATVVVLPYLPDRGSAPGFEKDGTLTVRGLVVGGRPATGSALVATGERLVRVPLGALSLAPQAGLDPDLGARHVTGDVPLGAAEEVASPSGWAGGVRVGRLAAAAELVGVGEAMLEMATAYVSQRRQFGRPIGAFQAVKHRLADVHVGLCAALAASDAAWEAGDDLSALATKCLAGRAVRDAATHCHQVHGAIAFTVAYGLHPFMRRGFLVDSLLGSSEELTWELGERLLADGRVPRQPAL